MGTKFVLWDHTNQTPRKCSRKRLNDKTANYFQAGSPSFVELPSKNYLALDSPMATMLLLLPQTKTELTSGKSCPLYIALVAM